MANYVNIAAEDNQRVTMKIFAKLLFIIIAFLLRYGEVQAFNIVYFRSSITSWDSVQPITNDSHDGKEVFSIDFDLEAGSVIEFKFYVVDDYYGSNYGWLGSDGRFDASGMSINNDYWGSKKYESNFKFTGFSGFSKYKATLTFDNHGGDQMGYWKIRIIPIRFIELRDYYDVK